MTPLPLAPAVEVKGKPPAITERAIDAFAALDLPLARSSVRDGYAETPWLDTAGYTPTSRRPVGPDVVRFRVWVDAARPNYSMVTVEPSVRRVADPSLPERELDRLAPDTHPAYARAESLLVKISGRPLRRPQPPSPSSPDSARRRPDTLPPAPPR